MKVTLPDMAVCALSLDDTVMQSEMRLKDVGGRRLGKGGQTDFEGDRAAIVDLVDTLKYRGYCQGGEGFDDPSSWSRACRLAASRIEKQLEGPCD